MKEWGMAIPDFKLTAGVPWAQFLVDLQIAPTLEQAITLVTAGEAFLGLEPCTDPHYLITTSVLRRAQFVVQTEECFVRVVLAIWE